MAAHPDANEQRHIRLTQWILVGIGLAAIVVIFVLAKRGYYNKSGTVSRATVVQHK